MFHERIKVLAETHLPCRIFTPFGEASGWFDLCDGEECHFCTLTGNHFKLFCVDILGLQEDISVPVNK